MATYRVQASFYVEADNASDAECLVRREINSRSVQRLIGEIVGEADVHDDAEEWDFNG